MAQEIADSKLLDTWGSSGAKIEPDISKIIEGWQLGEQPPHEYMNWLQNTFGSKLNHILKNGIAEWNNETEYLAGSSVKHSGKVWICETTNTNSEPTDLNANWEKVAINKDLTVTVDILDDLRSVSYPANTVWASGYHAKNDGAFGSHIFRLKGVKTTETDNGGTVIIATIGGVDYVYELQFDGAVNVKWFGAKGDGVTDDTIAFKNAIEYCYIKTLFVMQGYYIITEPLLIKPNWGIKIRGDSCYKGSTVLLSSLGTSYPNNGLIEVTAPLESDFTHSGFVLDNITLQSNLDVCHGLYIKWAAHCLIRDVRVTGFKGAGILLDKVQDSQFNFVEIQACGRTSGTYGTSDIANDDLTLYSPLHMISTMVGDACNMNRFDDMQIEANLVSPYIYSSGTSIGIWFSKLHMEHRDMTYVGAPAHWGTFFRCINGEYFFTDIQASQIEYFAKIAGYGGLTLNSCGRGGKLYKTDSNTQFGINITNSVFDGIDGISGIVLTAVNSRLGDVSCRYSLDWKIDNCSMESYFIFNQGGNRTTMVSNSTITGDVTFAGDTVNNIISDSTIGGTILGNMVGGGNKNQIINTSVGIEPYDLGALQMYGGAYKKKIRETSYPNGIPNFQSACSRGDICWNTTPTPGGYIGYVCVSSGTPGTWKGFGLIEA